MRSNDARVWLGLVGVNVISFFAIQVFCSPIVESKKTGFSSPLPTTYHEFIIISFKHRNLGAYQLNTQKRFGLEGNTSSNIHTHG